MVLAWFHRAEMVCVGGQELKVRIQRDQKKDIHIFLSNLK